MLCTKFRSSWLAVLALFLLSSTAYAGVVGSHDTTGVLNATFNKPNLKAVKTVSATSETWVFKANNTFSRGTLTGKWKQKNGKIVLARHDKQPYINHLSAFWADRGVTVSNIKILDDKTLVQQTSNGLCIESYLKYKMHVSENGGVKKVVVTIKDSSIAPDSATENPALREIFPTMLEGQDTASYSGALYVYFNVDNNITINAAE
jgi:hypothetical protein